MGRLTRRSFLVDSGQAAVALGLARTIGALAQAPAQIARIVVDTRRVVATLDRRLFGSFLEHLGRAIYGGIYEPGSGLADTNGFCEDGHDELRTLGVPVIR